MMKNNDVNYYRSPFQAYTSPFIEIRQNPSSREKAEEEKKV